MGTRVRWFGARAAILATTLVAVLSVATGLANIATGEALTGPLAAYVPRSVQQTAGFTGTITGFMMLVALYGLRRRLRAGWYATVLLLPVTAAQGLLQSSSLSYPLVALSLAALVVVVANRRTFDRGLDLAPTQWAALAAVLGAQLYGTVGSYALREHFDGIDSLTDAFWYTLVTGSTVGYGDITPNSFQGQVFGMSLLLLSVASFAVALGVLLTPAIEARLTRALGRMTDTNLDLLENHILVLGYGELTEPILEELAPEATVLVITPDETRARALVDRDVEVLTGDPSDEEVLHRANVEAARAAVAATTSDAEDALAILTARQLNPGLRIVAAATDRENADKLRRAGADTVISPTVIGGHLLAESALGDEDTEELEDRILEEEADDRVEEG